MLVCVGAQGLRDVSLQHRSNYDFQDIELSGYNGAIESAWKVTREREQRAHPWRLDSRENQMESLHYLLCTAGSCAHTHTHMQNP